VTALIDDLENESHPGKSGASGSWALLVAIVKALRLIFLGSCIPLCLPGPGIRSCLVALSIWVGPPQFFLFVFFGSHCNNRIFSMQAAGFFLMALLCACGPAAVRGQPSQFMHASFGSKHQLLLQSADSRADGNADDDNLVSDKIVHGGGRLTEPLELWARRFNHQQGLC
jgi:hypothetical protein